MTKPSTVLLADGSILIQTTTLYNRPLSTTPLPILLLFLTDNPSHCFLLILPVHFLLQRSADTLMVWYHLLSDIDVEDCEYPLLLHLTTPRKAL